MSGKKFTRYILASIFLFVLVVVLLKEARKKPETRLKPIKYYQPSNNNIRLEDPSPLLRAEEIEKHDLQIIDGIGPKIASILSSAGITSFNRLAAMSSEEITTILKEAGLKRLGNPQSWIVQAKYAAESDWTAFKNFLTENKT